MYAQLCQLVNSRYSILLQSLIERAFEPAFVGFPELGEGYIDTAGDLKAIAAGATNLEVGHTDLVQEFLEGGNVRLLEGDDDARRGLTEESGVAAAAQAQAFAAEADGIRQ